jgi:two-component SAPR family response regulator
MMPQVSCKRYILNNYFYVYFIDHLYERLDLELYEKIRQIDKNVKVCFITAYDTYHRALQDLFPTVELDCVIKSSKERLGEGDRRRTNQLRVQKKLTLLDNDR